MNKTTIKPLRKHWYCFLCKKKCLTNNSVLCVEEHFKKHHKKWKPIYSFDDEDNYAIDLTEAVEITPRECYCGKLMTISDNGLFYYCKKCNRSYIYDDSTGTIKEVE